MCYGQAAEIVLECLFLEIEYLDMTPSLYLVVIARYKDE